MHMGTKGLLDLRQFSYLNHRNRFMLFVLHSIDQKHVASFYLGPGLALCSNDIQKF